MKVRDLLEVSPSCDTIEVVIRKEGHGMWLQGFRVSKNAKVYPVEQSREFIEMRGLKSYELHALPLKENEEVDTERPNGLKMKIICKDPIKAPAEILNLEIAHIQPRWVPHYHKEQLTHNEYCYDLDCFPPSYQITHVETKEIEQKQLEGQTNIFDFIE